MTRCPGCASTAAELQPADIHHEAAREPDRKAVRQAGSTVAAVNTPPQLRFLEGIGTATPEIDVDVRTASALVTFTVDGQRRWSASCWLEPDGDDWLLDGFVLRDERSRLEIVVRDMTQITHEPLLARVAETICQSGTLKLPNLANSDTSN
jgi:hypothetical protein